MQKSIPQQALPGIDVVSLKSSSQNAGNTVTALVVVQLLSQLCLKGSLDDLWTLFFTMQIMCYLRIYDVVFPTNANLYLIEFTKIIEFDILNPAGVMRFWYPDFTYASFIAGAKADAKNMMDDLSIYILALGIFGLFSSVIACIAFCKHKYQKQIKKLIKKVKQMVLYNMIIRSITISYIMFAISAGY